jgi:hypothetical protein
MLATGQWTYSSDAGTPLKPEHAAAAAARRAREHALAEALEQAWQSVATKIVPNFLAAMRRADCPGLVDILESKPNYEDWWLRWRKPRQVGRGWPVFKTDFGRTPEHERQSVIAYDVVLRTDGRWLRTRHYRIGDGELYYWVDNEFTEDCVERDAEEMETVPTSDLHQHLQMFAATHDVSFDLTPQVLPPPA